MSGFNETTRLPVNISEDLDHIEINRASEPNDGWLDELQVCDEPVACHLEILLQLLPMKQITRAKPNRDTSSY